MFRDLGIGAVVLASANLVAFLSLRSPADGYPSPAPAGTVAAAPPSGGRIALREERLRFGDKFEDETVKLLLHIRNVGTEPLVIGSIKPGCGCAAARVPEQPIPPGGESPGIPIDITLRGIAGPYAKTGFVASSDPTAPRVPFYMEGQIHRRLDVEPSSLRLQPESHGASATGSIRVTRLDGGDLGDLVAESPLRELRVEIRRSAESVSVADVHLEAPQVLEMMRTGLIIRIATVERVVPVVLAPRYDVECDPPALSTGLTARGTVHSVRFTSAASSAWSVKRLTTGRPDLLATMRDGAIEVTWAPDAPDGIVSGEIEVTLEGARPETLRVPVTSFLARRNDG